jgi:IS4 transposase
VALWRGHHFTNVNADPATGKRYVFLTNNFKLAARTIADIYKARWDVELFFKWIKQNLKIKSFIGTSKNAVMTQIWIALCMYLLLAFIKFQSKLNKSMQQILRLLQLNLFEKRDLLALLRGDPPIDQLDSPGQMVLL